jgi:hypothetical protein
MHIYLSLCCCPTLEHRVSVKRYVSLQFLNHSTVGRTPWTRDQPVARPLSTQTQNKRRQTSIPWVGFEPTIPVFERAKTVHACDRNAYVLVLSENWLLCLLPAFTQFLCSAFSSTMKLEATCSSEMSVDFQRTTRRYIAEDRTLRNHRCENFKS